MSGTERVRNRPVRIRCTAVDYVMTGLVLWSLSTAVPNVLTDGAPWWGRLILVAWVALGVALLWRSWRPRRTP